MANRRVTVFPETHRRAWVELVISSDDLRRISIPQSHIPRGSTTNKTYSLLRGFSGWVPIPYTKTTYTVNRRAQALVIITAGRIGHSWSREAVGSNTCGRSSILGYFGDVGGGNGPRNGGDTYGRDWLYRTWFQNFKADDRDTVTTVS